MLEHPVYRHIEAIKKLGAAERAELHALLERYKHRWLPLPGPQDQAYHSLADIVFFGGTAGSSKTELLLGLARNAHKKSIIFRRTYGQLTAIKERGQEIISAKLREFPTPLWRLSDGRTIELAAVQHEADWDTYQGRPHDLIAFDEICQFSEDLFRKLIGWLRHPDPRQRKRIVCAGNPPLDPVGDWVVRYWGPWLNPGDPLFGRVKPGELVWYTTIGGEDIVCENGDPFLHNGKVIQPMSRTFIPAKLSDNPYLMLSGYESVLQGMPEPMRSQLLDGDFLAGKVDNARQVIPSAWVDAAMERWKRTPRPDHPVTACGVDVARGGPDNTVLSPRRGSWFAEQVVVPGRETPDGDSVALLCSFHVEPGTHLNVDVIGVGAAAVDCLRRTRGPDTVYPIMVSEGTDEMDATGNFHFKNVRSMLTWRFREALDPGLGSEMCLPPDPSLKADLCAPLWKTIGNKIEVEPKDAVKKRIGRSPDRGDSAIYALVYHHTQVAVALGSAFR